MGKYKVRYHVGPRYGRGYWQTEEFDSRGDAVRFRDEKCRQGRDAELIEPPAQERYDPNIQRAMKTVERQTECLFSGGSDLHLI